MKVEVRCSECGELLGVEYQKGGQYEVDTGCDCYRTLEEQLESYKNALWSCRQDRVEVRYEDHQ